MSLVLLFIGASFVAALLRLHATYPGFAVAGRLYAYTFLPSPPFAPDARRRVVYTGSRSVTRPSRCAPGRRHLVVAADSCGLGLCLAVSGLARPRDQQRGRSCRTSRRWASSVSPGGHLSRATRPQTRQSSPRAWRAGSGQSDRLLASASWSDATTRGRPSSSASSATLRFVRSASRRSPISIAASVRLTRVRSWPCCWTRRSIRQRLTDTVRRTLLELAPGIRVYTVQPLSVHVARSFGQLQWITSILIGLGVLALLLAAVGLYGAIAYRVSLRTREIGLRMALGATRLNVFRGVVGSALAIVVVGVAIGEVLTTVLTGIVASVQENIGRTPVSIHVIVGLIWIAIGVTASYVPAARAARLDPSVALREE